MTDPVKGTPGPETPPRELGLALCEAALDAGFAIRAFGWTDEAPLFAFTRPWPNGPRLYVSAGIHGDEPAPVLAILELLRGRHLPRKIDITLCPFLNPAGWARRTRGNAAGVDLNRDYRAPTQMETIRHRAWLAAQAPFERALCLHEDWEARGFYLYELNPHGLASVAHDVLAAAAAHVPLEPGDVIDGRPVAEPSIIRPEADPEKRDQWPESICLAAHGSRLLYTFESPSSLPLDRRIAAHVAAVLAAS